VEKKRAIGAISAFFKKTAQSKQSHKKVGQNWSSCSQHDGAAFSNVLKLPQAGVLMLNLGMYIITDAQWLQSCKTGS
jgi:hypothetical protein